MVQVYYLFRQLGLRHIFVVPRASRVIGMITRKDLLIEVLKLFLSQTFPLHPLAPNLQHSHLCITTSYEFTWLVVGWIFIYLFIIPF